MSIKDKKRILMDYYRKNGGLPKGNLDIDADTDTVGNVLSMTPMSERLITAKVSLSHSPEPPA